MRNQIELERYAESVRLLSELALEDTDQSRAAAQVLLSAFRGSAFQVNIVDLCALDDAYFQAAMAVIHGRRELNTEPPAIIENGEEVFLSLWDRWLRYHVENRGKPSCGLCFGSGSIPEFPDDEFNHSQIPCTQCEGRGY